MIKKESSLSREGRINEHLIAYNHHMKYRESHYEMGLDATHNMLANHHFNVADMHLGMAIKHKAAIKRLGGTIDKHYYPTIPKIREYAKFKPHEHDANLEKKRKRKSKMKKSIIKANETISLLRKA